MNCGDEPEGSTPQPWIGKRAARGTIPTAAEGNEQNEATIRRQDDRDGPEDPTLVNEWEQYPDRKKTKINQKFYKRRVQ